MCGVTKGVIKINLTDDFSIFLTSGTTVDIYENTTSKRNNKSTK